MSYFVEDWKMKESAKKIKSFIIISHHPVITTVNMLMHMLLFFF